MITMSMDGDHDDDENKLAVSESLEDTQAG